ncbi:MAG: TOPRIM nucleotidyl transferase/hydrolase domain-containing protein, partial [Phycisphaerales bacterium JB038]
GISVIPCHGKSNIDKPTAIFQSLGIPVFMIWDGDQGKRAGPRENHTLLRLAGAEVEDWPAGLGSRHCCFRVDLDAQLEEDLGERFDALLTRVQDEFSIPKRAFALKKPEVVRSLVER